MPALCDFMAGLGYGEVKTLLNSGNVVFGGEKRATADIEAQLEQQAAMQLKLRTDFLVRTRDELAAVIAGNPFPAEAKSDPSHLLVMFLKSAPAASTVEALRAAISGREAVHLDGRHLYVTYPDGIGRSRLTSALIESKLATPGTGRNWNTVLKLMSS